MPTPDEPGSLLPPTTIGPFRVLHQVGVGVLGPVYRAHDPDRDALVAVKLFKVDLVPEQAQRLADVLGRLTSRLPSHPGLVPVLATGVERSTAWLAEEFVPYDSLDARLRRRAVVTLPEVLPLVTQLASAIDAAAATGTCHGALHPRDVLVATTGEARVTGFGVAAALAEVGVRRPARRPYAAPERLAHAAFDERADVFALGALVFELLAGRRLSGPGTGAVAQLTALGLGVDVDACRRALAAALDDDVTRRLSSASTLAMALAEAAGESFEAVPLPRPAGGAPQAGRPGAKPLAPAAPVAASVDAEPVELPLQVDLEPSEQPWFPPDHPDDALEATDPETGAAPSGPAPSSAGSVDHPGPSDDAGGADTRHAPESIPTDPPPAAQPEPPRFAWEDPRPPRRAAAAVSRGVARVPLWTLVAGGLMIVALGLYWWGSRPTTPRATVAPAVSATPAAPESIVEDVPQLPAPPEASADRPPVRVASPPAAARPTAPPASGVARPTSVARPPVVPAPTTSAPTPPPGLRADSGPIEVVSRPAGARVFIDDRPAGVTPLRLPSLPTGSRTIRLELDGYGPWALAVVLEPGAPRRVAASLERIRQP
ncbi:MAG: protein kinase [Acidobacteria bacterium]|nr:protein kinase [Acidobacteriota bacterium]